MLFSFRDNRRLHDIGERGGVRALSVQLLSNRSNCVSRAVPLSLRRNLRARNSRVRELVRPDVLKRAHRSAHGVSNTLSNPDSDGSTHHDQPDGPANRLSNALTNALAYSITDGCAHKPTHSLTHRVTFGISLKPSLSLAFRVTFGISHGPANRVTHRIAHGSAHAQWMRQRKQHLCHGPTGVLWRAQSERAVQQ